MSYGLSFATGNLKHSYSWKCLSGIFFHTYVSILQQQNTQPDTVWHYKVDICSNEKAQWLTTLKRLIRSEGFSVTTASNANGSRAENAAEILETFKNF